MVTLERITRGFTTENAIPSAFFMATRFGTSSPNTSVKYDRIIVITVTVETLRTDSESGILNPLRMPTRGSAKDSAAKALARKPASVIPIWMVARNLLGSPRSFIRSTAFLSPASAISFILLSLSDMRAISDAAKNALTAISIIRNIICVIKTVSSKGHSFFLCLQFTRKSAPMTNAGRAIVSDHVTPIYQGSPEFITL